VFTGALGVGLLGLVHVDRYLVRRPARAVGAAVLAPSSESRVLTPGRRLALFIACGIGLHNFAEGLSIGQSAARGQVSLAVLLIVGFGLHNATEGFGIVAPLAQETEPVSWRFLGLCGVIGGLPTFLGTIVGHAMVNDALAVGFLALAAGSIVYVIIQLVGVAIRLGYKELLVWGLFVGFLLGLGTDFVLVAADL
jgi:ZIP family zinc transporter